MYYTHFGLIQPPYKITPDTGAFFCGAISYLANEYQARERSTLLVNVATAHQSVSTPLAVSNTRRKLRLEQRLDATKDWLVSTNQGDYSIQILLANAGSVAAIERFLTQPGIDPLVQQIFVYQSEVRNTPVLNVLYGRFSSFSNANQALEALPDAFKRFQPYIRNMRDIQASQDQAHYARLS